MPAVRGEVPAVTWSVNRLAGRAVALHLRGDVGEKRELLEMLGVVDPGGHVVLPDDRRSYHLEPINDAFGDVEGEGAVEVREPRRGFTTPPGLANLPPVEKKKREPRREPASHGSWSGRRFHTGRGEPQCRECADFYNAWRRSYNQKRAQKEGRPYTPAVARDTSEGSVCGTERGWSRHRRRGEDCDACHEAYRVTARERGRRTRRDKRRTASIDTGQEKSA